jgi:serine protease
MTQIRTANIQFRGQHLVCMPNQLSVKVAPHLAGDRAGAEAALRTALGPSIPFRFIFPFDERGVASIELEGRANLESVADQLERHAEIVRAAPITVTTTSVGPRAFINFGDPLYPQQWGVKKIRMPEAWGYGVQQEILPRSKTICVAVLDSGLPFTGNPPKPYHENMDSPSMFLAGSNFITPGTPPDDDFFHGTFVTGIIAAMQSGRGIVGVNYWCTVYVEKVLDSAGRGSTMLLYKAVQEAVAFVRRDPPVLNRLIINYSAGGPFDPLYEDVADVARSGGALLVAAAGNSGGPVAYPAALSRKPDGSVWYPNVCAVSATDRNDVIAPFSNFGPQISVCAPGVDIVSALPYPVGGQGRYGTRSGTSMAAPFVSGVATLIWAKERNLAASEVREQLEKTAEHLGAPPDRNPQYGSGRVDAFRAIHDTG